MLCKHCSDELQHGIWFFSCAFNWKKTTWKIEAYALGTQRLHMWVQGLCNVDTQPNSCCLILGLRNGLSCSVQRCGQSWLLPTGPGFHPTALPPLLQLLGSTRAHPHITCPRLCCVAPAGPWPREGTRLAGWSRLLRARLCHAVGCRLGGKKLFCWKKKPPLKTGMKENGKKSHCASLAFTGPCRTLLQMYLNWCRAEMQKVLGVCVFQVLPERVFTAVTHQDLSSHGTGSLPGATAGKVWDKHSLTKCSQRGASSREAKARTLWEVKCSQSFLCELKKNWGRQTCFQAIVTLYMQGSVCVSV